MDPFEEFFGPPLVVGLILLAIMLPPLGWLMAWDFWRDDRARNAKVCAWGAIAITVPWAIAMPLILTSS